MKQNRFPLDSALTKERGAGLDVDDNLSAGTPNDNHDEATLTASDKTASKSDDRQDARHRLLLKIKSDGGTWFFTSLILSLITVTGYAAYHNVATKGWNSDAAAWAQAAGSIIAIVGAAWLARSESRQARRWRREQGEEAAWAVRFVISQAQFDAQVIAAELTKDAPPYKTSAVDIRAWKQRSANASLGLQTMLTRADYIHPAVVMTACNAKILVDHLSDDLAKLDECSTQDVSLDEQLVADIVYAHINLVTLLNQFDARMRGVRDALDRGRDMLSLYEYRA